MLNASRLRKPRGLSLIEVLLASVMMLMLLLAFYAIAEALQRSQVASDARIECRQQTRAAVNNFALRGTEASFFYSGNGDPISIGGYSCTLPEKTGGDFLAGDTIVVAVPRDFTRPSNPGDEPDLPSTTLAAVGSAGATPDGFHDNRFDIVALTSRPTSPPNASNPDSRQLVLMRWNDREPAAYNAPLTIDLEALGDPDHESVYDASLKPLDEDGFRVNYGRKGTTAAAAYIHADYRYQPLQGSFQSESYDYVVSTRNIF